MKVSFAVECPCLIHTQHSLSWLAGETSARPPGYAQLHWRAPNDALQPCGARRQPRWRDRSKVRDEPAYDLIARPLLGRGLWRASNSGCTAMLFDILRNHLPAPRVPRDKPPTSERRGRITKLGVGRGLLSFSETNSCQCIHSRTSRQYPRTSSPHKRDSGYTPCSA